MWSKKKWGKSSKFCFLFYYQWHFAPSAVMAGEALYWSQLPWPMRVFSGADSFANANNVSSYEGGIIVRIQTGTGMGNFVRV